LGSSRAETNTTTARIKTKQRGPKKNQEQEELSGEEPKEKTREEERNIRPVAFREYHSTAEMPISWLSTRFGVALMSH
jgi:hypothetical protein